MTVHLQHIADLENIIQATQYIQHPLLSEFHKCYILNRQLKPLFATSITFCFIPSFLCSTARRLTKQFLGFVGSYCTQWDQHDACCACRLLLSP